MMTMQEIYTTVRRHLLRQNARSIGILGLCAYRSPDGSRCAVGCLIPDEMYDKGMEGDGVALLPAHVLVAIGGSDEVAIELLSDLQRIHDTIKVEDWMGQLNKLAESGEFVIEPEETD